MKLIGDKNVVALELGEHQESMQEASIWLLGLNVSGIDKWHYFIALITAIEREANNLKNCSNFFKHQDSIVGSNLEERFAFINQSQDLDLGHYELLCWGPPTDHLLVYIIPLRDEAFFCYSLEKTNTDIPIIKRGKRINLYDFITLLFEIASSLKIIYNERITHDSNLLPLT